MNLIKPFAGLRPTLEHAAQVIAPPYDVLSSLEARQRAQGNPYSFLHISKPEIDLPTDTDPYAAIVYQQGQKNFNTLIQTQVLKKDSQECYYLYRLTMGNHQQTGLVAAASVKAYDANKICKHEFTRPQKEDDRVKQITALQAQTGPVFLAYRHQTSIDALLRAPTHRPDYDIMANDTAVRHELWVINDAQKIAAITAAFAQVDKLYIADGHHRSAAASRVAQAKPHNPAAQYFLSVIFPDNQLQILGYHRVIKDLNGLTIPDLLKNLETHFAVTRTTQAVQPQAPHQFGLYVSGQWYHLTLKSEYVRKDPIQALDVASLADYVLAPLFNITDPRRDTRIDFIGGIRGAHALQQAVDSGEFAAAFALYPTTMTELLAVADQNEVMPPKSTWFEPKLADGLVSYVL